MVMWVLCFYVLHEIIALQALPHPQHQQQMEKAAGSPCHHASSQAQRADMRLSGAGHALSGSALWAAALSLLPFHWFYSFLFYTDVGAHLSLLTCLLLSRQMRFKRAACAGAVAVLFRQTNAVRVHMHVYGAQRAIALARRAKYVQSVGLACG